MVPTPLGATLSIAAVDKRSGEMGAAVLSQSFSAGSRIVWSEPGVGVVVAQGNVEPTYGPLGLALLKGGKTPPQALKSLLATDPRPGVRQVMMIDSRGRASAHTGKGCLPESGYLMGRGFCVQANFVGARRAWKSMAGGFRKANGSLAVRLVAGLEAGDQAARGRRRGGAFRSASVVVLGTSASSSPWDGRAVDLRVDNGDAPLRDLKTMLRVHEGYVRAASATDLLAKGELERGAKEFSKAVSLAPDFLDLKLWFALGMMNQGEWKRGAAVLRGAIGTGKDARAVLREMVSRGIVDEEVSAENAERKKAPA